MDSFRQILNYIKSDFEISEEEKENVIEVNMDFIKLFHKEFNKFQEKFDDNLSFLDSVENKSSEESGEKEEEEKKEANKFEHLTVISRWFKNNRDHPKFAICKNNLYALICLSQDIMGTEMIKGLQGLNGIDPNNFHEYIQNIMGGDSPIAELLKNSPLGEMLSNPELKNMIESIMEKLKNIDIEDIMRRVQNGDISAITSLLGEFGGAAGSNPALANAMGLFGGLMGGGDDEMVGMTPQQRANYLREKRRTEYRRKIRAQEKDKKKKRDGNRKKKRRS